MKGFLGIIVCLYSMSLWSNSIDQAPFVTARIYGQLGNNMFQVATASALAWDNEAKPCFPDFQTDSDLYKHVFFRVNNRPLERPILFQWDETIFWHHTIPFHPDMLMIGYFQSEKYFAHYRDRLLELYEPHPDDMDYMQKKYDWLFTHPNTVGVQLRYYKWEHPTGDLFPQYGKEYLEATMRLFPSSSLFVVSSNNLEFARKNIPEWAQNVVFLENEPNYIDMNLLRYCKHNIITNSSFGWWAAWLNQNPDKKVVRPAIWINGLNTQDVCPQEWISVNASYE